MNGVQYASKFSAHLLDCLTKFRVILKACGKSLEHCTGVNMDYFTLRKVLPFYVDVSGGVECQASWVETCKTKNNNKSSTLLGM